MSDRPADQRREFCLAGYVSHCAKILLGSPGRGFAVVAADVRSLAKDSAENAEKIKDLVKRVQQQVARVAADIEHLEHPTVPVLGHTS